MKKIYTTTVSQSKYGDGPMVFDGLLDDAIAGLNAIRDGIPEEYRAVAKIEISTDYDGYVEAIVTYDHYETDDEYNDRIKAEKIAAEAEALRTEHKLRKKYERLKAKFEPNA